MSDALGLHKLTHETERDGSNAVSITGRPSTVELGATRRSAADLLLEQRQQSSRMRHSSSTPHVGTRKFAHEQQAKSREFEARLAAMHGERGETYGIGATLSSTGTALSQATWFDLFKRTDENSSGLICFGEWSRLVRNGLGVSEREFSSERLKRAWLALDTDGSGFINAGEWAAFMRKGEPQQDAAHDRRLRVALVRKATAAEVRRQCRRLFTRFGERVVDLNLDDVATPAPT